MFSVRLVLLVTVFRMTSAVQFGDTSHLDAPMEHMDEVPMVEMEPADNSPVDRIANMTLMTIRRCLEKPEALGCLRQKLVKAMELAIRDNGTWRVNDFIAFERNPDFELAVEDRRDGLGRADDLSSISDKISRLLQSRRVQFHTNLAPTAEEGRRVQGRRKKNKHGGGMMIGGFAMAALYAQIVLGKITMLAAGAFVLAKLALIVATAASLKKHVVTTTASTDHIVYADHGGHDAYRRNTYRSMMGAGEYATPPPYPYEASDELRDRDMQVNRSL